MRDDLPSVTAIYVAMARALASKNQELSKACKDPGAEALLPWFLQPLVDVASGPVASDALRSLSFGMQDHLALRTALIDSAVSYGVEHHDGGDHADRLQLVVLGAGLDSRAHRLDALAKVRVFEVDHPATQKLKQRKAKALPLSARELRYVPCDFQRTKLDGALLQAGFDTQAPALWIWEGVTMYLPEAAVRDSVARIAQLSAKHSLLITTYLTPDVVTGGGLLGRWAARGLGLISEPLRFTTTPDSLARLLGAQGFEILSDAAPVEAAPHYEIKVKRPSTLMPKERICVSQKR
ncbi:MAG TPA: class I SAM-dependent methyltransferase [Polyangiales bacterium]|nr:class I SAM-dependent methyltransferase [Polyangiales bacterium]